MYGMIHKAARELAIQEFGEKVWESILNKCELDDRHFISGQHYDDATTMALIGELVEQTGLPQDDLLTVFGRFWIKFVATSVYGSVIDMTGDTLVTFLKNLNRMHDSIKATMPNAVLPSFQVQENNELRISVLYTSPRDGLEPFVKGLLEGLLVKFDDPGIVTFSPQSNGTAFVIDRQQNVRHENAA